MFSVQQMIGFDLAQRLSATSRQASPDYLVAARLTLESLLRRPDCLAGVELGRKKGGYARTLLFGDDQLSLWAMVWDVSLLLLLWRSCRLSDGDRVWGHRRDHGDHDLAGRADRGTHRLHDADRPEPASGRQ